jgi:parallel beta-helix repeat protein
MNEKSRQTTSPRQEIGTRGRTRIAAAMACAIATLAVAPAARAAVYVVSNVNDSGAGSLRKAIDDANAAATPDVIRFLINGASKTIKPATPLPAIWHPVVIDGTQQPGYAGSPIVELDGSLLASGSGLVLYASNSTVQGVVVNRFPSYGIQLEGAGNTVRNCFVGTDPTGTLDRGNASGGISVGGSSSTIGGVQANDGNLISGNGFNGILVWNAAQFTAILGNRIGTDKNGTAALGNDGYAVRVFGPSTVIGAVGNGRNLISGNGRGVSLEGDADATIVRNNVIGLNATGTAKLPNDGGIRISTHANLIGGSAAGAGNVISGNDHDGIAITGGATGNTIAGNRIGTNLDGTVARGNAGYGIRVLGSTGNLIGGTAAGAGNLISGNGRGISFEYGASGNEVFGNVIGLNAAGTAKLPNAGSAVQLSAPGNVVGGTIAGKRNVLSGNSYNGIAIDEDGSNSVIKGNYIGTDATGTQALGNDSYGIRIISASGCQIGGPEAGAGNVVSGNGRGISLEYGATGNTLQGNVVGLDRNGSAKLANHGSGFEVYAPGNTIGGTAAGAGNVISGNDYDGVVLSGAAATGNVVQGNKIGTAANGTTAAGNRYFGVSIYEAFGNTIGGTAPGAGNVIARNEWRGVVAASGHGNSILGNAIFGNAELGIDLDPGGLVPNDAFDSDLGANRQQNFPVLSSVVVSGAQTTIAGVLRSAPSGAYRIELFASPSCDESGFGEEAVFLGATNVSTDANGEGAIQAVLPLASPHPYVTATATSAEGDTSELSPCALVGGANPGTIQFAENPFLGWEQDGFVTIAVTRSLGVSGTVSVHYATKPGSAQAPADYTHTSGTLTFTEGEVVKTFTVPVVLDDVDEGNQETIGLELSAPTGGATLGAWATSELILIDYDDDWPNVSMSDAAVVEGNSGTRFASFILKVSPSSHPVTVQYGSHDGTAKAGQDYQQTSGSITFQPGDGPKSILVPVFGDTADEDDEVFYMHVYDVGQGTVSGSPTGVILDDDGPSGSDLLFKDGFESGHTGAWSSVKDDGSGVAVTPAAALKGQKGLEFHVDDVHKLWVQDDSPNGETRYRARFHFDPGTYATGGASGQKTTRIFAVQQVSPAAVLSWLELRSKNGGHQIIAKARVAGGTAATPWIPLAPGAHAIELRWSRSSSASANDGLVKLWVDGAEVASLAGLDIETGAVDRVRLGAVAVKSGAQGTLHFDAFESRRISYIGPEM